MIKLIIAGSRNFNNYTLLEEKVDEFLREYKDNEIEIVSGTARGADKLGELYALTRSFKIKKFPANWNLYGRSAGYKRNAEMANYASHCVVFWDGESRGTKHMIDLAKQYKLELLIVRFEY